MAASALRAAAAASVSAVLHDRLVVAFGAAFIDRFVVFRCAVHGLDVILDGGLHGGGFVYTAIDCVFRVVERVVTGIFVILLDAL